MPIALVFRYNDADVAQAGGHTEVLAVAYLIDAASPAIENPLNFPPGTFVLFPPSSTNLDTAHGTITVQTQALGSVVAVVANPVSYVQTLAAATRVYSSFDPASSTVFGTKPQFSYLRVVEPQVGTRLLVQEPETGNYAYLDAGEVGPSGPPPGAKSAAVVRSLLRS